MQLLLCHCPALPVVPLCSALTVFKERTNLLQPRTCRPPTGAIRVGDGVRTSAARSDRPILIADGGSKAASCFECTSLEACGGGERAHVVVMNAGI